MNKFIQAYNTIFSSCPCPQNPSQNSSNNITNYQHYQNFISYQHCPNYTMTKKNTTLQKCSKANITTWSIIQCPKFQQDHTTKWQCLTIKLSMKQETTFFQTKKPKKNSPWCPFENMEHGSWGLEGAPLIIPFKMMDDISCHEKWEKRVHWKKVTFWCNEKMGLKMGFTKNGCVAKVFKNTRI